MGDSGLSQKGMFAALSLSFHTYDGFTTHSEEII